MELWNQAMLERGRELWDRDIERKPLQELLFETTTACNLTCRHCGSACVGQGQDIDADAVCDVLDEIAVKFPEMGKRLPRIVFSGGEPTLHPRLEEMLFHAKQNGFVTGVVTNGTRINTERAEMLARLADYVSISIDGTEETHAILRGDNKPYRMSMDGIHNLIEAGRMPSILTVVGKFNIDSLPEMKTTFEELGIGTWRISSIDPFGRALENPDIMPAADTLGRLLTFVETCRHVEQPPYDGKERMNIAISCSHYLAEHEGLAREWVFRCGSGIRFASVLADGSITGCLDIRDRSVIQGNIHTDSFVDVWENRFEVMRENRAEIDGSACSGCVHAPNCRGGSMHTWDFANKCQRVCIGYTPSNEE